MEEIITDIGPVSSVLGIDATGAGHLSVAIRWSKLLAIFGIVLCGLLFIVGFVLAIMHRPVNGYSRPGLNYQFNSASTRTTTSTGIVYIIISVLHFFPSLFLLQFSNKMYDALARENQTLLNDSLQSLKKIFRYLGILSISVLVLYIVIFFFAIAALALR